jgi:dynein heavy chain
VEELKNQVLGGEDFDEKEDKDANLDEKIEAFVELGFSSNISFGHRSTVRSEFMRFLRLAYLLDFLTVDSLGKMVLSSLQSYMEMLYGGKLTSV